mgnify:CR=1 FL=1
MARLDIPNAGLGIATYEYSLVGCLRQELFEVESDLTRNMNLKLKIKEKCSVLCGNHNSTPYLDGVSDQLVSLFKEWASEMVGPNKDGENPSLAEIKQRIEESD